MSRLVMMLAASTAILAAGTAAAPAERGADGEVKIIYWQAPSILNPYLSGGTKDVESSSLVIEPLARFNEKGEIVAWLAEEVPTVANGGVAKDLTSITWKLKEGLKWSDGTPVTSADVVFTAEYCMHPEGGCAQLSKFEGVESVEAVDDMTVKVTFNAPKPYPYLAFSGAQSPIIQKAQFQDCMGAKAPECTEANFHPIGTGPFRVTEFRPNDVITFEANPEYRDPSKPAFATVTFKGGGDAAAAGRAVMETGEFDYAWNLQLAPDVLAKMAESIDKAGELSPHAPRIVSVKIPADRIGELIGPGGKNIKGIQAESGAEINIEDDGTVHIYASKEEGLLRAKSLIERMFQEIEVGKIYTGKVVSITAFGAFMEVLPGKDGLIHVSELAEGRTERVEDVVKKGDVITAKCLGVDEKGRVKMSRRAWLRDQKAAEAEANAPAEAATASAE